MNKPLSPAQPEKESELPENDEVSMTKHVLRKAVKGYDPLAHIEECGGWFRVKGKFGYLSNKHRLRLSAWEEAWENLPSPMYSTDSTKELDTEATK